MPAEEGRDRARLAAEALADARADARARGEQAPAGGARAAPQERATRKRAPRDPARRRREDPQPLRAALDGLLADEGWRTAAAIGSLSGRWADIVGPDLAAHTRPGPYRDGELVVAADSTAWATQVRLLAATLVRRLNEELGDGRVVRVRVRGPAPPPRGGRWHVRGGRGPRDDYG